jgi:hypothetical protein
MPFLAVTGTHGWTTSMNKMEGGIQINMRHLNQMELHEDGMSARLGGGIMQYEAISALFEKGKQGGLYPSLVACLLQSDC